MKPSGLSVGPEKALHALGRKKGVLTAHWGDARIAGPADGLRSAAATDKSIQEQPSLSLEEAAKRQGERRPPSQVAGRYLQRLEFAVRKVLAGQEASRSGGGLPGMGQMAYVRMTAPPGKIFRPRLTLSRSPVCSGLDLAYHGLSSALTCRDASGLNRSVGAFPEHADHLD